MSISFNQVTIAGYMTRDIVLKYLENGTAIANFSVAINERYKDKDIACFVECSAFGKLAEIVNEYCGKGSPVLVNGKLRYSTWESIEGGKRSKLTVTADRVVFLGNKSEGSRVEEDKPLADDEVPF